MLDTNDRPTGITLTSSEIYENATAGTVLGTLLAQDQDANQTHFFSVIVGGGTFKSISMDFLVQYSIVSFRILLTEKKFLFVDFFYVNGTSLLLSDSVDYETTPVLNVTIIATDSGTPPLSLQVCLVLCIVNNYSPSFAALTLKRMVQFSIIPELKKSFQQFDWLRDSFYDAALHGE